MPFTSAMIRLVSLALVAGLAACGGGNGSGNGGGQPAPSGSVTLSGFARFEFPPPNAGCNGLDFGAIELRPIRGATVEVVNPTDNSRIASTSTDDGGFYSLSVAANTDVFVRVRSELKRSGSPSWDVEVRNNTLNTGVALGQRPLYFLDSAEFNTGTVDRTQDMLAATGWDGSSFSGARAAAPFSVLDVIYKMMQRVVLDADPAADFPPLDAFWSPDNNTSLGTGNILADIDVGDITSTSYIGGNIGSMFLLGKEGDDIEEFDDHVIAHEWGHYFEDKFSRTDTIGGQHTFGDRLDMRLAFGEGFGNAISGIGLDDPRYCDTLWVGGDLRGFGFDLETVSSGLPGWFNEFSITSLIYDLWDGDVDGVDTASIGFGPIYDVLTGPQKTTLAFTSAFTFFEALKAEASVDGAFVDALLTQQLITAVDIDAFARSESNDAGGRPDVLPIYTDISLNDTARICVNNQFDSGSFGNKLSEYRYLRFELNDPRAVTFTVTTVDAPTQPSAGFDCTASTTDPENLTHSDPDFQVWSGGQLVAEGLSCDPNRETVTSAVLPAATYVIDLNEFRHSDARSNTPGGFPERICFDVTIS